MFNLKDFPENPPRAVSLLSGLNYSIVLNKSMIFSVISFALIIGIFLTIMILSAQEGFLLPFIHMEKVEGSIIEVIDNSKCDRQSISIHYRFLTNQNRTYYGEDIFYRSNLYSSLKVGDSLPILYDPTDPSFNGIEGEIGKDSSPIWIFIIILLIFLSMFASILMPNIKQVKAARSVFKNGLIANGEIIFIRRKKPTNIFNTTKFLTNMEIFFRFSTKNGEKLESKITTDNDWLSSKLEIGSSVTVAYMEKRPQKNIILEFYYR